MKMSSKIHQNPLKMPSKKWCEKRCRKRSIFYQKWLPKWPPKWSLWRLSNLTFWLLGPLRERFVPKCRSRLIFDDFSWFLEPRSSIFHNVRTMFGMLFGYVFHIIFLVVDICFSYNSFHKCRIRKQRGAAVCRRQASSINIYIRLSYYNIVIL